MNSEIIHPEVERVIISLRPYQKVAVSWRYPLFLQAGQNVYPHGNRNRKNSGCSSNYQAKLLTIGKNQKSFVYG